MSSTTATMRHGSFWASRSSETVERTQTTSPARLKQRLWRRYIGDLAGDQLGGEHLVGCEVVGMGQGSRD